MGIGMNGDDIVLKLSMDMKDLQKSLSDLYRHVQKTMDDVEEEFSNSAKGLSKLTDAVKDFQGDVNKHFNKVKDSASDTSTHMVKTMDNGFGKIISGAKKVAGALAVAFSVREVAQFGKQIIEASAGLEAMEAQFTQVMQFKDAKGNITDFADEATDRLNKMRSEWDMELNTIKGDYSAFVSQFKGLGLDMEKSLDSSDTALTLAADAAAMYNMSMQEAIEHVRSFVKGNYVGGESIQLFGSENMMKAWLEGLTAAEKKAMGLNNEWKDMAENEKQLVRLNFAKEQQELAGTTGQAARESGLYQNQLTKLKQKWTDFKAELGTQALEGVTGAFKVLSEVMENINTEAIGEGLGKGIEKIVSWFDKIDWFTLGQQLETIWGYVKEFGEGALDGMSEALGPIAGFFEDIVDAIAPDDVNTENMDAINKFLVTVKPIFEWLANNGEKVGKALTDIAEGYLLLQGIKTTTTALSFTVDVVKSLSKGELVKDLVEKGLGESSKSVIGSKLVSALGGTVGVTLSALAIPIALSFTVDWWASDDQKESFAEKLKNRFGMSIGEDRSQDDKGAPKKKDWDGTLWGAIKGQQDKSKNKDDYMNGDSFDWKPFKKSLKEGTKEYKKFVKGFQEDTNKGQKNNLLAMLTGSSKGKKNKGSFDWEGLWKTRAKENKAAQQKYMGGDSFDWEPALQGWTDFWTGTRDIQETESLATLEGNKAFWKQQKEDSAVLSKDYMEGDHFDWSIVTDKFKGFWDDSAQVQSDGIITMSEGNTQLSEDFGTFKGDFIGGIKQFGSDLKQNWKPTLEGMWEDTKEPFRKLKESCSKLFFECANALTGGSGTFGKTFEDIIEDAIIKVNIKLNRLIGTINEFFKELGIDYQIGSVNLPYKKNSNTPNRPMGGHQDVWAYAKGTNNAHGGLSLVGEAGRELVSDPRLGTFLASTPTLLNLSKGASVLSNKNTEKVLKSFGVKAYAKGKNEGSFWGNVWEYVKNPSKLLEKVFGIEPLTGSAITTGLNEFFAETIKNQVSEFFNKIFNSDEVLNHPDNPDNAFVSGGGAGYATAMTWAKQALEIAGYIPKMKEYKDFMTAFKIVGRYESNYNNASINKWDDNAKKGTPSAGWLQFIQPTFKANAFKGYGNWGNGLHQALAFINYANRRYGGPLGIPGVKSILRGGKYKPYANGGLITNPTMALMGEAGTEAVVPLSNAKALKPFGQSVLNAIQEEGNAGSGGVYEFTIPLYVDGREIAKATASFTKQELDKLDKRNNRLNGRK